MPRMRRIDYPGAWHHLMNRGARKEPTFRDPDHCALFFEHLGRVVKRFGIEVHAYVLMPNHFHLLVRSVRGELSDAMKHLLGPYTQILNKKHGWDGPVFRGRFRNQLVSESDHLRVLIPYIHLNPVRARLVNAPEHANWSSYTDYIGWSQPPEWLTTATVLDLYGSLENLIAETRGYHTGELDWPTDFDLRRGIFRSWDPAIPRTPEQKSAWKEAQVARIRYVYSVVTNLEWEDVRASSRGRNGNPARRLAVWMLANWTDLSHVEVGKVLGLSSNQVGVTLHTIRNGQVSQPLKGWLPSARFWLDREVSDEHDTSG